MELIYFGCLIANPIIQGSNELFGGERKVTAAKLNENFDGTTLPS